MIAVYNTGEDMTTEKCAQCEQLSLDKVRLEEEMYFLENRLANADAKLELIEIEKHQLTTNLAELSEYVLDLERSLAEVHLMSQDDGPENAEAVE